jgi:hypothetical protein
MDLRVMRNYISLGYVKNYHIKTCDKEKLYKLTLANGSLTR